MLIATNIVVSQLDDPTLRALLSEVLQGKCEKNAFFRWEDTCVFFSKDKWAEEKTDQGIGYRSNIMRLLFVTGVICICMHCHVCIHVYV
jgi:hypothetical protein